MPWRWTLIGASALVGCGSGNVAPPTTVDLAPSVASVPTVLPPRATVRDEGCPIVLSAIAAAESDCPDRAFSRAALEQEKLRDKLELCATRIEHAATSLHDQDIVDAATGAVFKTRVLGSSALTEASLVAEAALEGTNRVQSGDPAFVLALRQRAYSYKSTRDWCAIGRRKAQSESWNKMVDPILLGLQPQFEACAAEARQRLPLTGEKLTMNWRAIVETNGHPRLVAPVDFPSTMRADLAFCLLQVVEGVVLPPPEGGDAVVGSDVTFFQKK